jgi:hypothetical protein
MAKKHMSYAEITKIAFSPRLIPSLESVPRIPSSHPMMGQRKTEFDQDFRRTSDHLALSNPGGQVSTANGRVESIARA